jgi:quinohemoprotein ethanol dehydrogenase
MRHITALAVALAAVGLGACKPSRPPADVDTPRIQAADQEPGNWMTTGRTYDEQRFSPLADINQGNVKELKLAWTARLDVDRGVEATPLVVDGTLYTTGAFSIVYAFDADSGRLQWKYDPQVPREKGKNACCDVVNRGVAVRKGKVYVGAFDGRLIALEARSGKKLWEVDTRTHAQKSFSITGAPLIVKDKVLIGNGGSEYGVRGYLSAYDAETGKLAWRFFTTPGDPKQPPENRAMEIARKTWSGDRYFEQGGGGTVWNTIVFDPGTNLIYFGTGNGLSWSRVARGEDKAADNLFLSSIVAVNADTGDYAWHYQEVPGDMWDYDATENIVLADLNIAGKPRTVLLHAPKNGFFYVLDRVSGELISATKYAAVNWAKGVDLATGKPEVDWDAADWTTGVKVVTPGPLGAHNWQPMSFSPLTGFVYIPAQEAAAALAPDNNAKFDPREGVWNIAANIPVPEDPKELAKVVEGYRGRIVAWDPVAKRSVWVQEYNNIWNGGTLATAGGLVFQGTSDGRVLAYGADSGEILWESPANTGVMAGPMTYKVGGKQYVTVLAGWGGAYPLTVGALSSFVKVKPEARILTYSLGGDATLPPPKRDPVLVPQTPSLTAGAADVEKGKDLFNHNCGYCHGLNAVSGGVIPDLRYLSTDQHALFAGVVAGAKASSGMPSFTGRLTNEEVELIRQYVIKRSLDLRQQLEATD